MPWTCWTCNRKGDRLDKSWSTITICVREGVSTLNGRDRCCNCLQEAGWERYGNMACESCKRIKSVNPSDLPSLGAHYLARNKEEYVKLCAVFDNLPNPASSEPKFPAEKPITAQRLAIFEFDDVLFCTPKRPDWWPFEGYQTMMQSILPPTIPDAPGQEWWNQDVVAEAKEAIADPDTMAVLVTFRSDGFTDKLRALLNSVGIQFDEMKLRQSRPFLSALGRTSTAESGFGPLRKNLKATPQTAEDNHMLVVLGAIVGRCTKDAIKVKLWANAGEEGEAGEKSTAVRLARVLTDTDKCKFQVRAVKATPMAAGRPTHEQLEIFRAEARVMEEVRAQRAEEAWQRKEEERLKRERKRKEEEREKNARPQAPADAEEQRERQRLLQQMPSAVSWKPRQKQHPLVRVWGYPETEVRLLPRTRPKLSAVSRRRGMKALMEKKRQEQYEWKVQMGYVVPTKSQGAGQQTREGHKQTEREGHKQTASRRKLGRQFPTEINYVAGKQFSRVTLSKLLYEQFSPTFRCIDEDDDYNLGSEDDEVEWDWEPREEEDGEEEGWDEDGSSASMYSVGSRVLVGGGGERAGSEDWESSSWVSSMGGASEGWSEITSLSDVADVDSDSVAGTGVEGTQGEQGTQVAASGAGDGGYLSAVLQPGTGMSRVTPGPDSEAVPTLQSSGRQRSRSLGHLEGDEGEEGGGEGGGFGQEDVERRGVRGLVGEVIVGGKWKKASRGKAKPVRKHDPRPTKFHVPGKKKVRGGGW